MIVLTEMARIYQTMRKTESAKINQTMCKTKRKMDWFHPDHKEKKMDWLYPDHRDLQNVNSKRLPQSVVEVVLSEALS